MFISNSLWLVICKLMRMRVQFITLMWIRIQRITLKRIRILPFHLMRIRFWIPTTATKYYRGLLGCTSQKHICALKPALEFDKQKVSEGFRFNDCSQ